MGRQAAGRGEAMMHTHTHTHSNAVVPWESWGVICEARPASLLRCRSSSHSAASPGLLPMLSACTAHRNTLWPWSITLFFLTYTCTDPHSQKHTQRQKYTHTHIHKQAINTLKGETLFSCFYLQLLNLLTTGTSSSPAVGTMTALNASTSNVLQRWASEHIHLSNPTESARMRENLHEWPDPWLLVWLRMSATTSSISNSQSPLYNRTSWLDVKHQLTYSDSHSLTKSHRIINK